MYVPNDWGMHLYCSLTIVIFDTYLIELLYALKQVYKIISCFCLSVYVLSLARIDQVGGP